MRPRTIEQAITAIPEGWLLHLAQTQHDWSASLLHDRIAWQVSERGADPVTAIVAVSARVREGRLNTEFPAELAPAYRRTRA